MESKTKFRVSVVIGRLLMAIAGLALLGALVARIGHAPVFGAEHQHLVLEAIAFAALGIGWLMDGLLHAKGL